jgi:NAD(P)-dependent dehydrogenase (short-subunit alcohol dehydrogenase family)
MPERNVALVTGTSSGIGLHAAVGLAGKGIRVVATMRDPGRAAALLAEAADQGVEVTVRELDVTDRDGARPCLDEVEADFGRPGSWPTMPGWASAERRRNSTMLPCRNSSTSTSWGPPPSPGTSCRRRGGPGSGRIISVTSAGGEPFLDAYCASQLTLEGMMQSLAPVAARFGVVDSVVEQVQRKRQRPGIARKGHP